LVGGGFWTSACDRANGKNAASSARARWSRLKIVTDVGPHHRVIRATSAAGPLGDKISNGRSFSLAVVDTKQRSVWDLVQLRVRLGQWRKYFTALSDLASYRGAPGLILLPAVSGTRRAISPSRSPREWTCRALVRAASLRRRLIWNVGSHFRRVVWVENASSGCRTTRQTGISMSHRSPLQVLSY
jgi:hypothetical protein